MKYHYGLRAVDSYDALSGHDVVLLVLGLNKFLLAWFPMMQLGCVEAVNVQLLSRVFMPYR